MTIPVLACGEVAQPCWIIRHNPSPFRISQVPRLSCFELALSMLAWADLIGELTHWLSTSPRYNFGRLPLETGLHHRPRSLPLLGPPQRDLPELETGKFRM